MGRDQRRIDHVMSEIRRSRPRRSEPTEPGRSNRPQPSVEGWMAMRDLMQRTREREDGTWYLTEDARAAAAEAHGDP